MQNRVKIESKYWFIGGASGKYAISLKNNIKTQNRVKILIYRRGEWKPKAPECRPSPCKVKYRTNNISSLFPSVFQQNVAFSLYAVIIRYFTRSTGWNILSTFFLVFPPSFGLLFTREQIRICLVKVFALVTLKSFILTDAHK